MKHTPFYANHLNNGGKIVDFGGWALPVNYGSQIKEHEQVRSDAGMFDVSHMVITDIYGIDAKNFLRQLITNDVSKLDKFGHGKALYSAMLNHQAGVIDDLIVYLMPFGYRLVTNAATENKDLAWIKQLASNFKVELKSRRDLAMLAVQGPQATNKVIAAKPDLEAELSKLKPFMAHQVGEYFYARTGYTGENGLEIMLPVSEASNFWDLLIKHGVLPCGLGARDTLRLEAGMNLYGHEMDESITPLACGMDWVVDLTDPQRDFIGKKAYLEAQTTNLYYQCGLVLLGKGILRDGQKLYCEDQECGIISSGTFSPSLKISIAMARIKLATIPSQLFVDIRGKFEEVQIVKLPFVRNGKQMF
ncbi:MAG: glycine cleavage system protein [Pseudomonadota bacterium]|jgi:aminomethyltransferase